MQSRSSTDSIAEQVEAARTTRIDMILWIAIALQHHKHGERENTLKWDTKGSDFLDVFRSEAMSSTIGTRQVIKWDNGRSNEMNH
jgi:hypothetical protein